MLLGPPGVLERAQRVAPPERQEGQVDTAVRPREGAHACPACFRPLAVNVDMTGSKSNEPSLTRSKSPLREGSVQQVCGWTLRSAAWRGEAQAISSKAGYHGAE